MWVEFHARLLQRFFGTIVYNLASRTKRAIFAQTTILVKRSVAALRATRPARCPLAARRLALDVPNIPYVKFKSATIVNVPTKSNTKNADLR